MPFVSLPSSLPADPWVFHARESESVMTMRRVESCVKALYSVGPRVNTAAEPWVHSSALCGSVQPEGKTGHCNTPLKFQVATLFWLAVFKGSVHPKFQITLSHFVMSNHADSSGGFFCTSLETPMSGISAATHMQRRWMHFCLCSVAHSIEKRQQRFSNNRPHATTFSLVILFSVRFSHTSVAVGCRSQPDEGHVFLSRCSFVRFDH